VMVAGPLLAPGFQTPVQDERQAADSLGVDADRIENGAVGQRRCVIYVHTRISATAAENLREPGVRLRQRGGSLFKKSRDDAHSLTSPWQTGPNAKSKQDAAHNDQR